MDWLKAKAATSGIISTSLSDTSGLTQVNSLTAITNKLNFTNYNIFYKNVLDKQGSDLMVSANYASYSSYRDQIFDQYSGVDNQESTYNNHTTSDFNIYTGALDYTKSFSKTTHLESGLKYVYTKNSSQQHSSLTIGDEIYGTTDPDLMQLGYTERISAAYLNLNHSIGKISLQAGLRLENSQYNVQRGIDSFYFNFFPNVRIDLAGSKNASSSIGYARNINRPAYDNLIPYTVLIDNYTIRMGNPFLKPEYANTFTFYQKYKKYSLIAVYTLTENSIFPDGVL